MDIKSKIKKSIRKIKYGVRCDSETYVNYLRKLGMSIGERTVIFDPRFTLIDETRPWAVEIGDDVQITHGVTILTHGYDWSVLKGKFGTVLGSYGGVHIGNNVFIGMNTTILKGVHIGDNVIIGAGSLVNKNIPDDCVAAGNPAKVIMTIEEYHKKRQDVQLVEARELVCTYRSRYHKNPGHNEMAEFFWLYTGKGDKFEELPYGYKEKMELVGNLKMSKVMLEINNKDFNDLNGFLDSIE